MDCAFVCIYGIPWNSTENPVALTKIRQTLKSEYCSHEEEQGDLKPAGVWCQRRISIVLNLLIARLRPTQNVDKRRGNKRMTRLLGWLAGRLASWQLLLLFQTYEKMDLSNFLLLFTSLPNLFRKGPLLISLKDRPICHFKWMETDCVCCCCCACMSILWNLLYVLLSRCLFC